MTFRSKPAVKRSHRPSWEEKDRRNLYINIGFAIVIVIGVLALAGAALATYYEAHFASVATVNGTSLNKDQLADQAKIDSFRIDQAEAHLRDLNQLGRLSDSEYQTRLSVLEQQRTSIASAALDRLIDNTLQGQLAAQQGITVTDAQIDQRLVDEATTKEQRHLAMISVEPEVTSGASAPTDAQKTAAKAKAEAALADVKGGQKFADVAQKVSTDTYAANGGDTGWSQATDPSLDPALLAAAFTTAKGGLTDVIEGADGTYRFAQVVDIAPQSVDGAWLSKIDDAGIPLSTYRGAVRSDLTRDALKTKIVADVTEQATPQRQVSEIFVSSADYQGPGDQVKVRHILYTPGDADPSTGSPVPSDAASVAAAKAKAQATYDKLKALQGDPAALLKEFESIAQTDSKDTASGAQGGELGWFTAEPARPRLRRCHLRPGPEERRPDRPRPEPVRLARRPVRGASRASGGPDQRDPGPGQRTRRRLRRAGPGELRCDRCGHRRRHALGRPQPAGPEPRGCDLRRPDRQAERRPPDDRRVLPLPRPRRADSEARRCPADHAPERCLHELVHDPAGEGRHQPRHLRHHRHDALTRRSCSTPSSPRRDCAGDSTRRPVSRWSRPSTSWRPRSRRRGPC